MTLKSVFQDLPTLETPRLILRQLRMDDAEDMFEYAQDRDLGLNGLWLSYTQLKESIDDLAEAQAMYTKGNFWDWAIEHRADHKMIGRLGLHGYHAQDNRADLGYALNRKYWGQGYGTEAARRVVQFGFEVLGLHRISASVLPDNIGSIRVLTKIGMQFEGVKRDFTAIRGQHEDLHSYSILKPEWENKQPKTALGNIQAIPNSETLGCRVYRYRRGHSVLIIETKDTTGQEMYLVFEEVIYFSGNMMWKGANFQSTTDDEFVRLMNLAGYGAQPGSIDYAIERGYRLYSVPNTNPEIKILSHTAYWTDDFDVIHTRF